MVIRILMVSSELYFPQSNFTLRLPYLARDRAFSPMIKLIGLRTLRNDSSTPENVRYEIFPSQEKFVIYQKNTSNLLLRSLPKNGALDTIVVKATEKNFGKAVLEIKVRPVPVKTINCTDYVQRRRSTRFLVLQDMCFWNTSRYRIYENQPVTMIGTFGPEAYSSLCPEFRVAYELLNGSEYFHIVDGKLFANASLDRDIIGPPKGPGPRTKIQVTCIVWDEKTGLQHTHTNILSIDILDEDDNPPLVQGNTSIVVKFQGFKEGDRLVDGKDIVLKDADVVTSNQYNVRLLGDTHKALNMHYEIMPIEHAMYPNQAPSTAILPVIYGRKTLLPESPYRVVLQITDESLREGYGPNSINISLTFNGPVDQTPITTSPSIATRRASFSYPKSVKIARISPKYLRVAKPSSKPHPSVTFTLHNSSAFNVTRQDGIVYVSDETKLRSERDVIQLKLEWTGADSNMTVQVNLIEVPSSKIDMCGQSIQEEKHSCANAESREDCEKSCGTGSGVLSNDSFVSRCMWRSNNRSSVGQMSKYYSTCSPDLTHCPDNECDELERSDPRICPQDCTVESEVFLAHMNEGDRGIKSGLSTCACDDRGQCQCGIEFLPKKPSGGGGKKNGTVTPGARKASSGPCGPTCMIGVIGASLFVLIVILGSFVTWRYRMAAKGARRECKHRVDDAANGIGILPSDYIDRGDGLLIGLDTFTAANRHLLLPKTCPPDPKWEFPRSLLKIEQVLGEGEFGRVLRAKAMNIGGMPGATTVAVKTLKEDACTSELADLLSEYQLLKEAQHPNVIRLLGACTTPPGAPVYLIIEFAEFGSLRNYLRRSRHLETEDRVPGSTSLLSTSAINASEESQCTDNNASNYTITPRDILSFAWQISKGMTYLADIKLVHRDLAARNVLLATGKVCKISDFGLTRDVYEDDAYLKRSKGRVPVKWMAPESLADHVYTSKSDVWSFGVLLWELVTLGASPYPGVDVHNLYNLLKAGYRMEKPPNCSQQLYKLMVSCWHQEPAMRPSFKELTMHWERMLEDGVEYLDLNPRTVHNQAYFASLQVLDSPNDTGNDQLSNGTANTVKTDIVNYLGRISSEPVTKCDKVDKLQAFWQPTVASFPEEPVKSPYVNDRPESLNANHYESPIKLRNVSVTSNSENDLRTPPNERPQSYIDMQGRKSTETEDLLVFNSMDDDKSDNNVTN
nr:PREDICTED: proto-oncogene tyrosine-protein kinase receptor Ret isoform X1 [Linepithema humile]XP_012216230.1 PREDICTED: proto-oncogene tyrosine-protein kinase receptor Ret isoform X1 [Linepithema humile]XP_012216231.1 PREDICTED: proto-oncogene tyrosine-protein kinase receptor Ret isoform X1 [Linepithema humile]XP_012216232.1 PREDICTED: proto-oncogene tyrosine-protein kinase receptor Ret isoform X1 [Linepithema humile]